MMATTDTPQRVPTRIALGALATLATALVCACAPAHAAGTHEARLLAALRKAHPGTRFTQVSRSPVAGVYEVWMNGNVAYVAASNPRYFIFGRVFDTQTMRDITAAKLVQNAAEQDGAAQTEQTAVPPMAFDQLPLTDAIKTMRGNGQRRLAVFSDPNCVFCKQLEPELASLDNITVYTFLVPFQGEATPIAVWCAADRAQAWQRLMIEGDSALLHGGAACEHPIARNLALARQLGVQGTPTLFWSDGSRTQGFVERSVLQARLAQTAPLAAAADTDGRLP